MKKIKFIIPILIIIVLIGILFINKNKKIEPFYLEDNYYLKSELIDTDIDNINSLIDKKESFGLFIYQPDCITSANLGNVIDLLQKDYKVTFYQIPFSEIKKTFINDYVTYYPSFVIYKDGKLVDYLDASKDEDTAYFSDYDRFKTWFTSYINLKEKNDEITTEIDPPDVTSSDTNIDEITLESDLSKVKEDKDIPYDNGKINIYLFWGDGCPHCAKLKQYLSSIEKEYGKYYNLHTFEVFYNENNNRLFQDFTKVLNDNTTGVPYTVIGHDAIKGYADGMESRFTDAIMKEYQAKEHYDVYQVIKNK